MYLRFVFVLVVLLMTFQYLGKAQSASLGIGYLAIVPQNDGVTPANVNDAEENQNGGIDYYKSVLNARARAVRRCSLDEILDEDGTCRPLSSVY